MTIQLPYGKTTLSVDVPADNLLGIITPQEFTPAQKPEEMIREALSHPLGTDPLTSLVHPGDHIAIVIDDYTRPCPTQTLIPPLLDELHKARVDDLDILFIIANGTHTPPNQKQINDILGEKTARTFMVTSNDITNGDYINLGTTKKGHPIEILQDYIEADFKILLGDIEYHYFAGYGGARKSILPGLASKNTIQHNHAQVFDPHAKTGLLKDNPIHHEMNEALHLAGCDFVLNVVQNSHHRIVGAWAGKPEPVLDAGAKLVDTMYRRTITQRPDIIITAANGSPHDINLYQAMKAMHQACQAVTDNGAIILVAECPQGAGSQLYTDWLTKYPTSKDVQQALNQNFVIGAHKAYYHWMAVEHHPIYFVSAMPKDQVEGFFKFHAAQTPNEALQQALQANPQARVLVVPQGTTTLLCFS
jgi:lactate racemase